MSLDKILDTPQDPLVLDMIRKLQEQQSASAELFANPEVTNRVKTTLNTMRDNRAQDPEHVHVNKSVVKVTPESNSVKGLLKKVQSLYETATTATSNAPSLKGHNITVK